LETEWKVNKSPLTRPRVSVVGHSKLLREVTTMFKPPNMEATS